MTAKLLYEAQWPPVIKWRYTPRPGAKWSAVIKSKDGAGFTHCDTLPAVILVPYHETRTIEYYSIDTMQDTDKFYGEIKDGLIDFEAWITLNPGFHGE